MRIKTIIGFILCAGALAGCGGGGGGKSQPAQAVLKLSTQGSVTARAINGVQATINLPTGVTISADGTTGKIKLSALVASGVAAGGSVVAGGHYTAATAAAAGSGKVMVVNTSGFDAGEFATVTCDLAKGVSPTAADFTVVSSKVVDQNGAALAGVTVAVAVEVK